MKFQLYLDPLHLMIYFSFWSITFNDLFILLSKDLLYAYSVSGMELGASNSGVTKQATTEFYLPKHTLSEKPKYM